MKTRLIKNGDTMIIAIQGKIDFESTLPLREHLSQIAEKTKTDSAPTKIIVNMEQLEFVGSSGISAFIQTMKDFNDESAIRPRYCSVRSEFQRMIRAFDEDRQFDIFDSEEEAHSAPTRGSGMNH